MQALELHRGVPGRQSSGPEAAGWSGSLPEYDP